MAQWIYTELNTQLGYGGFITRRGYRCSNCGFFRSRKLGKSKYCEDCGEKMEEENEV